MEDSSYEGSRSPSWASGKVLWEGDGGLGRGLEEERERGETQVENGEEGGMKVEWV